MTDPDFQHIALALFDILDEIDTTDDIARGDDVWYRKRIRSLCRQRFDYAETDGYKVTFKTVIPSPPKPDDDCLRYNTGPTA